MEYRPRYRQPVTWSQLLAMEVSHITQEIARLQHSLELLRKTQAELKEHLEGCSDPELEDAVKANEETIGSQSERIQMLRLALEAKGFSKASNRHYDIGTEQSESNPGHSAASAQPQADSEEGVYL